MYQEKSISDVKKMRKKERRTKLMLGVKIESLPGFCLIGIDSQFVTRTNQQ